MTINKYLAALLSIAVLVVGPVQFALAGGLTNEEIAQLLILVAGAVVTFLVPLLKGPWAGLLKTGAAIVAAALTALVPFLSTGTITAEQWAIVAGAILNALAVEVGVQVRQDSKPDHAKPSSPAIFRE